LLQYCNLFKALFFIAQPATPNRQPNSNRLQLPSTTHPQPFPPFFQVFIFPSAVQAAFAPRRCQYCSKTGAGLRFDAFGLSIRINTKYYI